MIQLSRAGAQLFMPPVQGNGNNSKNSNNSHKLLYSYNIVIYLYILNFLMVFIDTVLYHRNKKLSGTSRKELSGTSRKEIN